MTTLLTLVLLAVLGGHAAAADTPSGPGRPSQTLVAVAASWDAGKVEIGAPVTHTYELRNQGSTPLQISVKASCGCTTTDYDPVIPAGGTGKVTAVLDTAHVRGRVTKTVHVTTNDPAQPPLTLSLIAETIRLLDVLPTDTPLLRGPVGALKPMELTITEPEARPFAIVRVEEDALLRAEVVPADPPSPAGHRRYRVTLTPKADLAVGTYHPTLTVVTTLAKVQRFPLKATIVVSGPLTALPPQVRVRSATTPVAVRITTAKPAPFTVVSAATSDRDFTASAAPADGGRVWDVTLRYVGKPDRRGPVNAVLTIATDEPTQPTLTVRIAGAL